MPDDPYYLSASWRRLRQAALTRDAFQCVTPGCRAKATIVDHVVPRNAGGSDALSNLRSLCRRCDGMVKERPGGRRRPGGGRPRAIGCDTSGQPLDPLHWWNSEWKKIAQS